MGVWWDEGKLLVLTCIECTRLVIVKETFLQAFRLASIAGNRGADGLGGGCWHEGGGAIAKFGLLAGTVYWSS